MKYIATQRKKYFGAVVDMNNKGLKKYITNTLYNLPCFQCRKLVQQGHPRPNRSFFEKLIANTVSQSNVRTLNDYDYPLKCVIQPVADLTPLVLYYFGRLFRYLP